MTTEEAKGVATYSNIVGHLLALRDEARKTSREEAAVIEGIISDVMAVQMREGYANVSLAGSRN